MFTEQGKTRVSLIKPAQMFVALSQDAELVEVAKAIEEITIQMDEEAINVGTI